MHIVWSTSYHGDISPHHTVLTKISTLGIVTIDASDMVNVHMTSQYIFAIQEESLAIKAALSFLPVALV